MKVSKWIGAFACAVGLAAAAPTHAQTTINFSIWVPPTHPVYAGMVVPWAEQVSKVTEGRVKVNILPKPLGGPPQHFDLARDGVADAMYTVHGYTPGRFVLTKMAELPFLGDSAEAISVAYWRVYDKYFAKADEHQGVKVLGMFTHGPGLIFTSNKPIQSVEDLKGLKFRVGGGVVNDVATALDMVAVLKPAPESYELLSNGVVDGVLFPMESIRSFKLGSLLKHATAFPGGLYNTSFLMGMNQAEFDKLSPQDQKAITSVSGEAFARLAGQAWDKYDKQAAEDFKAAGGILHNASPEFVEEVRKRTAPIEQAWIAEAKTKGVDGVAALAEFRGEIESVNKSR